jgi:hypothetical protein
MEPHAKTSSRINARLDEEHVAKVEYLKRTTGLSTSDLVKRGLDRLYEETRATRRSALEGLRDSGFIASGSGPTDLSERYKDEYADSLAAKYGDR